MNVRNPSIRDDILKTFSESWNFIYAGLAGHCQRCIITGQFGKTDSNSIGMNGLL